MLSRFPILFSLIAAPAIAETLYVSSDFTHQVLRYDATSGTFTDVFLSGGGLDQPHAILERCDDILVASFGTDQVLRYDRSTGAFLDVFIDSSTGLNDPVYILFGPDENLYISSQASDEVLRFSSSGAFIDAFVSAGSGGLNGPSGMDFGPDGRFYVAGRYSANVIAYNGATGAFDEVIADSSDGLGTGDTFGLKFGANDDLYFASAGNVFRYDLDTSSILTSVPVSGAIGIDADSDGEIYIATSNNLRTIDLTTDAVSGTLLTGGTINVLNFFHFSGTSGISCAGPGVPAASTNGLMVLVGSLIAAAVLVGSYAERRAR